MTLPGRCDPEIEAVLDAIPSLDLTDIPRAREERDRLAAAGRARWTPSGRVRVEDRWVPGEAGDPDVRVRVHRPVGESTGAVLLWVHGGGHVLGAPEQDDPLLDQVVGRTGCVALAVDWRRAPEHPYPAALHDCSRRPAARGRRAAGASTPTPPASSWRAPARAAVWPPASPSSPATGASTPWPGSC